MTWLVVLVIVLVALLVLTRRRRPVVTQTQPEPDAESVVRAAVELHAIRRGLDVAWTRNQLWRDSARLRRELRRELREDDLSEPGR